LTITINLPVDKAKKRWSAGIPLDPWLEQLKNGDVSNFGLKLVEGLHRSRVVNEGIVDGCLRLYRYACFAFGVEVLLWAFAVGF
jgi:hypothetical protein